MKRSQFETYLTLHGADLRRWPPELRDEAEAALSNSEELQHLLATETAFEELLRSQPTENAPEGLAARILAQAQPRERNGRTWLQLWANLWDPKRIMTAVAVLAVGITIGWYYPLNGQLNGRTLENSGLQLNNFLNYEEVELWPEN